MMKLSNFNLEHVRALHYLLEEAHVARAASRLAITPAAASNALRRLRTELNDPLLVRDGRTLVRTALAEGLRQPAREVMAAAARLLTEAAPFEPARFDGDLEVVTSDRLAWTLLGPLDRLLRERAPRCGLRMGVMPADLVDWARKTPGVVIAVGGSPGLSRSELYAEDYVCLLRADHPLLDGEWTPERFAASEHVLVAPRGKSDVGIVDEVLAAHGLSRRVSRTVTSFSLVTALLVDSDYVVTLPESCAAELNAAHLVIRHPPFSVPGVRVDMLWHPSRDADPQHMWLRGLVHEAAATAAR